MITKPTLANNRYELISTLGQGGMACVFKALDTRLKVEKAIKIPNHQCLTNKKIRDRFENEATTMAMLHHKNIVVVHDIRDEIYEDPGGIVSIKIVYMVMEMVPGGSLKDRIDDHGPLHPQQAIDAAIQMAEGLGYAHQNNVVHRDVKLDNVLIGSDNTLKVTDFGIAQIDGGSGMTQTGATMGTLAYMAPEQKLSSRRATALSDLYSVGASLYLMLTNRNPSELYAHDIQERGFADLPEEVAEVLAKCCHMDPKERYQDANELIEALKGIRGCFGELPPESQPFYIPFAKQEMAPEDIARQERKVTNMWTTLLGIDTDELSSTMPRPQVVTPQTANDTALDFGTFDTASDTSTAFDLLGLDLTGDTESVSNSGVDPTTVQNSALEPTQYQQADLTEVAPNSSSKMPMIIGAVALLGIGGWLMSAQEPPPVETTSADTTATIDVNAKPEELNEPKGNTEKAIPVKEQVPVQDSAPKEETTEAPKVKETPKPVVTSPKATKPKPVESKPVESKPVEKEPEPKEIAPPKPTTFGNVRINSVPYSNVFVNGVAASCKGKAQSTTVCELTLPVGSNKVLLRNKEGQEKTLSFKLKEGDNGTKCWSFKADDFCPQFK